MPLDRKGAPKVQVQVPAQDKRNFSLTSSGNFREDEMALNQDGITFRNRSPSTGGGGKNQEMETGESSSKTAQVDENEDIQYDINLSDLKVLKTIGTGSSGIVKKVLHTPTNKFMALKVIHLDVNDAVRKQILQELRTLHASESDYIVTFEGAFYTEGTVSIALEYMDGGTLTKVVKTIGALPEHVIAKIADQLLRGLDYLHKQRRLIHRDIKPSNLLLNREGKIKISDFGVSGQLANSVSMCVSWVGTVTYMSPERILGKQYGYNSDVWSLGLTLLECALGRFPYPPQGEVNLRLGFWELLDYIVEKPAPKLVEGEWSADFCAFVEQCLQKDPANRPGAADLLDHEFLKKHRATDFDLAEWIKETLTRMEELGKSPETYEEDDHKPQVGIEPL